MTNKGYLYVCLNGCLASEVPTICKFCNKPMKKVKRGKSIKGPNISF